MEHARQITDAWKLFYFNLKYLHLSLNPILEIWSLSSKIYVFYNHLYNRLTFCHHCQGRP